MTVYWYVPYVQIRYTPKYFPAFCLYAAYFRISVQCTGTIHTCSACSEGLELSPHCRLVYWNPLGAMNTHYLHDIQTIKLWQKKVSNYIILHTSLHCCLCTISIVGTYGITYQITIKIYCAGCLVSGYLRRRPAERWTSSGLLGIGKLEFFWGITISYLM
jgi:hypothetical protein